MPVLVPLYCLIRPRACESEKSPADEFDRWCGCVEIDCCDELSESVRFCACVCARMADEAAASVMRFDSAVVAVCRSANDWKRASQ